MDKNLSERDLLIELRQDFKNFKEYVTQELKEIKDSANGVTHEYISLNTRVTVVEQKEKENTQFRLWVYGSIVAGIGSLVVTVINFTH